jgi:hypothetical protein
MQYKEEVCKNLSEQRILSDMSRDIKKENIEDRSRSMFSGGEKTLSLLLSAGGLFRLYTYSQEFACSNNIKTISASCRIFIGKFFKKVLRPQMVFEYEILNDEYSRLL